MIQIDGPRRRVYIKFVTGEQMHKVLQATAGQLQYQHETGEITIVQVEIAGMGLRKIRIANLQPELPDRTLKDIMTKYGEVKDIQEEHWSQKYRYTVANGIRIVEINLRQHIPSHMMIADQRVLITYDGQPLTCYGCSETGHQYGECPYRRTAPPPRKTPQTDTWAQILANGSQTNRQKMGIYENRDEREDPFDNTNTTDDNNKPKTTQKQNRQEPKQQIQQEASKDYDNTHTRTETEEPQEPITMGSGKRKVQNNGKGKEEGEGNPTHTEPNKQNTEQEIQAEKKNSNVHRKTVENQTANEDMETTQPNEETEEVASATSPKRNKKQKTDRDKTQTRDRTRSRTRQTSPRRI
jgi:hypothetical protein